MPDLPEKATSLRTKRFVAVNLAARLLSQPWTLPSITDAIADMHPRRHAALARGAFALGEDTYPPAPQTIVAFLLESELFDPKTGYVVLDPPVFAPLPRFAGLPIPALATVGELAAWLGLSAGELDWFADERNGQRHARTPQLLHYRHVVTRKRNGEPRLLEAPKPRLKAIQRRILRDILDKVPVHHRAHGFVAGRSCLSAAQIHAGEAVVACFDLTEFFPSIGAPRIHGIFRSLGYPWAVARSLTGLSTTITPPGIIDRLSASYGVRHLPQGAPTSPALANLLAWRLDLRLDGLARAADAYYTRYADDLTFSGNAIFARSLPRFTRVVTTVAAEEGFRLNPTKTRIMPRHRSQRVTGLVVNDHVTIARAEFDTLKAILHNCARGDPDQQNRAAVPDFRRHLEGRIAWVEQVNPHRAEKLRRALDGIEWSGV